MLLFFITYVLILRLSLDCHPTPLESLCTKRKFETRKTFVKFSRVVYFIYIHEVILISLSAFFRSWLCHYLVDFSFSKVVLKRQ